MKITTTHQLDLKEITISRHTRSDLAKSVEKYWVGKKESNIGMQYLRLKKGRITASVGEYERKDLLCIQLLLVPHAGFNLFYEPHGGMNWNVFDGTELSEEETKEVEQWVRAQIKADPELQAYLNKEQAFLVEKPWMQVDGMTPAESVAKFKELGWY